MNIWFNTYLNMAYQIEIKKLSLERVIKKKPSMNFCPRREAKQGRTATTLFFAIFGTSDAAASIQIGIRSKADESMNEHLYFSYYSPMKNCRVYTLICFGGPGVLIFAKRKIFAYYDLALRPSRTRLKNRTVIKENQRKCNIRLFRLRSGVISYTLKEKYSLIEIRAWLVIIFA